MNGFSIGDSVQVINPLFKRLISLTGEIIEIDDGSPCIHVKFHIPASLKYKKLPLDLWFNPNELTKLSN